MSLTAKPPFDNFTRVTNALKVSQWVDRSNSPFVWLIHAPAGSRKWFASQKEWSLVIELPHRLDGISRAIVTGTWDEMVAHYTAYKLTGEFNGQPWNCSYERSSVYSYPYPEPLDEIV